MVILSIRQTLFVVLIIGLCCPMVSRLVAQETPAKTATPAQEPPATDKAQTPPADAEKELQQLEQLLTRPVEVPAFRQEVTTVTGQKSSVGRSPAAVFVITNDMIRRSGATSIPEALRMAPGLDVARTNSSIWAVGSRGFNGDFLGVLNNKLLVLIDGRTVFSPVTGGVFWDVEDVLLDDVDRIEVIRGPGATLWGANAVNGVINVITKKAADTQGDLIKAGGGSFDTLGQVAGRHGGKIGDDIHYRTYGKWTDRGQTDTTFDPTKLFPNQDFDQWHQGRVGFRSEWTPESDDTVTFQGDYYQGKNGTVQSKSPLPRGFPVGSRFLTNAHTQGVNVLGRWTHQISDDNEFSLQAYYDRVDRNDPSVITAIAQDQSVNTYDLDFRHHFQLDARNNIIWGAGYRAVDDHLTSLFAPRFFTPADRTYNLYTCFAQDEITLVEDRLFFTLGAKLLHYDLAPFEVQPSARLLWTPDEKQSIWAAVSRPVRTPMRVDQNFVSGLTPPPGRVPRVHDPNFQSEELMAYELGYRAQPESWFSWDLALFYNNYTNLETVQAVGTPFFTSNRNRGQGYGLELYSQMDVTDTWKLSGWYSFLGLQIQTSPLASPDPILNGQQIPGSNPKNQAFLMSSWDLTPKLQMDLLARYVDKLPALDVPSYITMDLRAAYRFSPRWEASVVGQNLLEPSHQEFAILKQPTNEIPRGVYAMLTWTR